MSKSTEAEILARSLSIDAARRAQARNSVRMVAEFCGHFVELIQIDAAEMERLSRGGDFVSVPVYYTLRDDKLHRVWPIPSRDIKIHRLQPVDAQH